MIYIDGSYYIGEYESNLKNGQGKFHKPSSSFYEGEWKDDQRDGHGVE